MEAIKKFITLLDKPNSELTFREKCRKLIGLIGIGVGGTLIIYISRKISYKNNMEKERRNKFKYFKPMIEEGIFSNKTIWIMRDKPLQEDELDELLKAIK